MSEKLTYVVPDMTCEHCKYAISSELAEVAGVAAVEVDLETKLVTVTGENLSATALRAAIEEAGYSVASQ